MTYPITGAASATGTAYAYVRTIRAPYMLLTDADYYFDTRLENDLWFAQNDSKRLRSLQTATRYIDRLNYHGTKTSTIQFREFPRNGGTSTPDDIKFACCEIAYNLLDGRDPDFESEHAHVAMSGINPTRVTKEVENTPMHILHNIPSSLAWSYLRPYLVDINTLQLQRTS